MTRAERGCGSFGVVEPVEHFDVGDESRLSSASAVKRVVSSSMRVVSTSQFVDGIDAGGADVADGVRVMFIARVPLWKTPTRIVFVEGPTGGASPFQGEEVEPSVAACGCRRRGGRTCR